MSGMALAERLRCPALEDRLLGADAAAALIGDGMCVAVSGFTPAGCPKAVPLALAGQVRRGERKLRLTLFSGASTGEELDSAWAECGVIARRAPYMTSKALRAAVNGGAAEEIAYTDVHLGEFAQNARCGFYGKIDLPSSRPRRSRRRESSSRRRRWAARRPGSTWRTG